MKTLLYMVRRYRMTTLLNIIGLSIAVAAFYLFMTQVKYNSTYNHGILEYERIFRLEALVPQISKTWIASVMRPLEKACGDLPHVEAVQSQSIRKESVGIKVDDKEFQVGFFQLSKPGVEFFGGKLLHGDTREWQNNSKTAILTRSEAIRIFGQENAVGKTMKHLQNGETYTVVGVCEDFPDNCLIPNGCFTCYGNESIDSREEWSYVIYLRLDNADNKAVVEKSIKHKIMTLFGYTDERAFDKDTNAAFRLNPLDETYFSGVTPADKGNRYTVSVLGAAAIFVLLVALFNFINVTLAQAPMRIRSINTRKVMGASVAGLRWEMVAENLVLTLVALALATLWILLFGNSSACMHLISGSIAFGNHPLLVAATLCIAPGIGALAALLPAWYTTSVPPSMVLKGSFGLTPRGRSLRTAMLFVQFVIAFTLMTYVTILSNQSHHIFNADYGFNKADVLSAQLSTEAMSKKASIATRLRQLPFVESVGYGSAQLGYGDLYMRWGRDDGDLRLNFYAIPVDKDFLQTIGIPIVEGRNFNSHDAKGAYIINREMKKLYSHLRVNTPIAQDTTTWRMARYEVVGVCEDFRLTSMRKNNTETPTAFVVFGDDMRQWGDRCDRVFVRTTPGYDKGEAKRQLADVLQTADPSQSYDFALLDDHLQIGYADEFRFVAQVRAFSLICILITLIGVFCLTMFEAEYRRKEIALRKIMGCSVGGVLRLFIGRYLPILTPAFAFSIPLGWYVGSRWLQNFSDKAPLGLWIYLVSAVGISAIVILTVVIQSWKVVTSNPIDSIKTE